MSTPEVQSRNVQKKLKKLASHPWLPKELLHLAGEVILLQQRAAQALAQATPLPLPEEKITAPEAHRQGRPLLQPEDFPYDAAAAAQLWENLLHLAAGMEGPRGTAAKAVRDAMTPPEGGLTPQAAFAAFTSGDAAFFAQWEERMPEAPAMTRFLAQASLTPWLAAASARLTPWHDATGLWEHGHCPHCGHLPFMGQLRGKEGFRWHVCSFCQLVYRVPRLQCPVCMEKDSEKLHFFTTANEKGYEAHVCESCKNYIKLHDMREKDAASSLPSLDDLDSLPLDLMARQQGYIRSTFSAWGF